MLNIIRPIKTAHGSFWPSIIITGNGNSKQIISHINADVKTPSYAGSAIEAILAAALLMMMAVC